MAFRSQRMALGATNRPFMMEGGGGGEGFSGLGGSFSPPRYRASTSPQPLPPAGKSPERLKTGQTASPKASSPKIRLRTGSPAMSGRLSASSPEKYFAGEREAYSHFDQARYQSGIETVKSTPRELGWSRVKDLKFEPTAVKLRLSNTAHQTKPLVRTVPKSDNATASSVLERQGSHFMPVESILNESKRMTQETRKSTEWVDLSKVSWGEVFPGGDRPPTDRHTKSFSVEGWGPGAHIDFDAFPTNQFMPDMSALLTSRVITQKTPPSSAGVGSAGGQTPGRGSDAFGEEARWDPLMMTNTQRISIADANAKDQMRSVKAASKHSKDGALRARDMVALQKSLVLQHGLADAVRTIEESQRQEGHMKGVIARPSNFKRPFSPVDFSVLTTTKQGRPMGEPLIGVGTHVPAGLPTNLRYNQRPEMIGIGNHCLTRKGHSNNFPFSSGCSAEGYISGSRILRPGEFIKSSHTLHPQKDVFRPSFDKGVEMDGQLAKGRAPRELTLYHCIGNMRN